eukprot:333713-Rhodomonas_salina.1
MFGTCCSRTVSFTKRCAASANFSSGAWPNNPSLLGSVLSEESTPFSISALLTNSASALMVLRKSSRFCLCSRTAPPESLCDTERGWTAPTSWSERLSYDTPEKLT